ncbi:MAG: hypothetical protein WC700_04265 [Gemmatimonadaceae bacterium]
MEASSGKRNDTGLQRNSTGYPAKVAAKLRELHGRYLRAREDPADRDHFWASSLKYYQYLVRAVIADPEYGVGADGNARGLLIYATMGMGKTRLAVAVAMSLWDARPPVIMLARSLRDNFRRTVEEVVRLTAPADLTAEELARLQAGAVARFTFVSMDAYNSAEQMARVGTGARGADVMGATGGLDGKLLVVDEAHNFFRAVINSGAESSNARRLYEMIMSARNLRIVFLTGTPASKDPFELVPCFNMLTGKDLLPTQFEQFYKLYVDREHHAVRNRERLANRLVGLVSHVSHSRPTEPAASDGDAPLAPKQIRDDGWFPERKPLIIKRVEMGPDQYRRYLLAREKEEAEGKGGMGFGGERPTAPLSLPGSEKKAASTYYVRSRTLSTFAPPSELDSTAVENMPPELFDAAASIAPKLELIADRIMAAPGPVLVYSQFVESALKPLGRILQRRGLGQFSGGASATATGGASVDEASPPLVIRDYQVGGKTLRVVRDDLLEAGTKQRAGAAFLRELLRDRPEVKTLLYTAPYNGYGPVAAAAAAAALGLACRLVLTRRPIGSSTAATQVEAENSPTVQIARRFGAQIEFADTWADLVQRGRTLERDPSVFWIPLGFHDARFSALLGEKIREAATGIDPSRIWVVAGTGALALAIAAAFPKAHVIVVPAARDDPKAVKKVRDATAGESRISIFARGDVPRAPTPYPTVVGYDSLAWDAAVADGLDGDYVWSTAGSSAATSTAGSSAASTAASSAASSTAGESGFPYRRAYLPPPGEMFARLRALAEQDLAAWDAPSADKRMALVRRTFPEDFDATDSVADHFVEPARVLCRERGQVSPAEAWEKIRSRKDLPASAKERRELVYKAARGCNLFNAALAVYLIRRFGGEAVLDVSAGWGDRLIAALAADVRIYRGWDPNEILQPVYKAIGEAFDHSTDWSVEPAPFESAAVPREQFDSVLFSPPFFDKELYRGAETSTTLYPEREKWYRQFYRPAIAKAAAALRPGGHFLAYIPSEGQMRSELDAALRRAGLASVGVVGFQQVVAGAAAGQIRDTFVWRRPGAAPQGAAEFVAPDPARDVAAFAAAVDGPWRGLLTAAEEAYLRRVVADPAPALRREYDPAAVPPIEYRDDKKRVVDGCAVTPTALNLHHGQRKLFVSELQCLTHWARRADERLVVVYAGAAPGDHIPLLLELFPGAEWHLYDPAPFRVRAGPQCHLYQQYFTDEDARSWRGRADVFICDIRVPQPVGPTGWSREFEDQVARDMAAQAEWTRLMAPRRGAMLKFRPPYFDPAAPASARLSYLRGRVLWQTWPAASSGEGRLLVEAADVAAAPQEFATRHYENAAASHNLARAWATYEPPAPGLDRVPGYDRCFDCTNEAAAWADYARAPGAARGTVAGWMNRLTSITHQRLDTPHKAAGERTTAKGGPQVHGWRAELPGGRRGLEAIRRACSRGGAEPQNNNVHRIVHENPSAEIRWVTAGDVETAKSSSWAIISGEVPTEVRAQITAAYNRPSNKYGAEIKAILLSKTGAEGLDLKNTRETYQVEPYWDWDRGEQFIARAVRLGSHDELPRAEREVQPYLYVAVANRRVYEQMRPEDREPKTTDEQFLERAADKYATNMAFRDLLAEVCLECSVFGYGNCRICVPTGAPLFHDDPALDIRLPDPCVVRQESRVEATPVVLDGVTYFYVKDPTAALGYVFYQWREDLGGHAPVDPADPVAGRLLALVEN